jgi:hypothetical protein
MRLNLSTSFPDGRGIFKSTNKLYQLCRNSYLLIFALLELLLYDPTEDFETDLVSNFSKDIPFNTVGVFKQRQNLGSDIVTDINYGEVIHIWSRCSEPLVKDLYKNALLSLCDVLVSIDDIQHLSLDNALFDPLLLKLFLSFKLIFSLLSFPPFPFRVIA